jgi:hypothetical protein
MTQESERFTCWLQVFCRLHWKHFDELYKKEVNAKNQYCRYWELKQESNKTYMKAISTFNFTSINKVFLPKIADIYINIYT